MAIKYRDIDCRKKIKFTLRLDNNTFSQIKEISINNEGNISDTIRGILIKSLSKNN